MRNECVIIVSLKGFEKVNLFRCRFHQLFIVFLVNSKFIELISPFFQLILLERQDRSLDFINLNCVYQFAERGFKVLQFFDKKL